MTAATAPLAFLASLQLADSFFPSGLYTQSHGLERLIEQGFRGEAALAPVVRAYLLHVAATGDALAARWAARAALWGDVDLAAAVDQRLEATKLSQEGRLASRRCGGRILDLGNEVFGGAVLREYRSRVATGDAPGHQAVALALVGAAAGLDDEAAVLVELHGFTVSLLSAAVRLGALDHVGAQRLLHGAQSLMAEAAAEGRDLDWRDLGGFAPLIDVAQFQHATALMHMFVS